jgi:ABC-type Fe3+-hydroxamate transport system substrate-binding protein
MSDDGTGTTGAPTRRDYVKYGGAVVGGGLLAGCTGGDPGSTPESTSTETATPESTSTGTATSTDSDASWTATMPPVGEVEFDAVPESMFDSEGFVADVVTALGHADVVDAFSYEKWPTLFYEELSGVDPETDFDTSLMTDGAADKEVFYEVDPDLITIDPNLMMGWDLDAADITEIQENVGPIFGQRARGPRPDGFYEYGDGEPYPYLDLYEQTEIYGRVFRERERASAIVETNRELVEEVAGRLPPESERPTVMVGGIWDEVYANVIYFAETTPEVVRDGEVRTYGKKQYRGLGVVNAFADASYGSPFWTTTDGEGLLEANPDVIFVDNGVADLEFFEEQRQKLRDDPVMSEVAAVKNDRIYPGGTAVQGPIVNMFQTEMAAKQLYPEEFGEWHGLGETPESERLFDRERVSDIVNGDI